MDITILKIFRTDKKKDGSKLIDKNGKEFWKTSVRHKHQDMDVWSTAFDYDGKEGWTSKWKPGDILDDTKYSFKENEWQGQKQFIISKKREEDFMKEAILDLQKRVEALERLMVEDESKINVPVEKPEPPELTDDDLPF